LEAGKLLIGINSERATVAFGLDDEVTDIIGLGKDIEEAVAENECALELDREVLSCVSGESHDR
jgi:hypothetical protein